MSSSVPRTGAQSVERAISVLYAFEGETRPLSISEVAGRVGLPVSTTHRIAQALVLPVARVSFDLVEELSETERGANGIGSTGVR